MLPTLLRGSCHHQHLVPVPGLPVSPCYCKYLCSFSRQERKKLPLTVFTFPCGYRTNFARKRRRQHGSERWLGARAEEDTTFQWLCWFGAFVKLTLQFSLLFHRMPSPKEFFTGICHVDWANLVLSHPGSCVCLGLPPTAWDATLESWLLGFNLQLVSETQWYQVGTKTLLWPIWKTGVNPKCICAYLGL